MGTNDSNLMLLNCEKGRKKHGILKVRTNQARMIVDLEPVDRISVLEFHIEEDALIADIPKTEVQKGMALDE